MELVFAKRAAQGNEAIIGYLPRKGVWPLQSIRSSGVCRDGYAEACFTTCHPTRNRLLSVRVDNDVVESDEFTSEVPARLTKSFANFAQLVQISDQWVKFGELRQAPGSVGGPDVVLRLVSFLLYGERCKNEGPLFNSCCCKLSRPK